MKPEEYDDEAVGAPDPVKRTAQLLALLSEKAGYAAYAQLSELIPYFACV